VTFIIPVRHPENAKDWSRLKHNLAQTMRSICAQDSGNWDAVVVANRGADLPPMPERFRLEQVDLPPNRQYLQGNAPQEDFFEAVRADKGRRILAGLQSVAERAELGHVMVVDDDDLISNRLVSFVEAHPADNGWFFRHGYVWSDGGSFVYRFADFSRLCGTSHMIRGDLWRVPERSAPLDEDYVQKALGSHIYLHDQLDAEGTPLQALPFVGAIYRTGYAGAHSRSRAVLKTYFLRAFLLKRPFELVRRLSRLKFITRAMRSEFFGESEPFSSREALQRRARDARARDVPVVHE
jgi:hypothetical protein